MNHLASFAKSDLASARRNGSIFVCGTLEGTLELRYSARAYTLTRQGSPTVDVKILAAGPARIVAAVLAGLYSVVEA